MARKLKSKKGMDIHVDMRGMDTEDWKKWKGHKCGPWCYHRGGAGCAYFLGFIGALVYFLQTSTGFWPSVLAILKAIVWPAFLVYKLFGL